MYVDIAAQVVKNLGRTCSHSCLASILSWIFELRRTKRKWESTYILCNTSLFLLLLSRCLFFPSSLFHHFASLHLSRFSASRQSIISRSILLVVLTSSFGASLDVSKFPLFLRAVFRASLSFISAPGLSMYNGRL